MPAKGSAEWKGDLPSGAGTFTAGDTISGGYTFKSRFEDGPGSNPEQFIAAAHAACFSMALSNMLSKAGNPPDSVHTDATVTLRPVDGTPTITKIALVTVGRVPGIDEAAFIEHAQGREGRMPGEPGARERSRDHAGSVARAMTIVDDLVAHPGLYLGIDAVAGSDLRGAARIVVTQLPGGSGVELDYEVLNPAHPDRIRGHVEHTILARTNDGGIVMVIGHPHADSVAILRESEPGIFEIGAEGSPFPMRVELSMPSPGRLRHAWWYGRPGEEAVERDVSVLDLAT